jgi:hypothetical protein
MLARQGKAEFHASGGVFNITGAPMQLDDGFADG